jgi:hypothetical protein
MTRDIIEKKGQEGNAFNLLKAQKESEIDTLKLCKKVKLRPRCEGNFSRERTGDGE